MTNSFTTKKVVALGLGLALAFSAVFVSTANAQSADDLQTQISNLLAMIATLQAQLGDDTTGTTVGTTVGTTSGSTAAAMQFTLTHRVGDRGGEVMNIQKFLNANGFIVSTAGAGSPGMETSFFGPATRAAAIAFQNNYASEILAPVGLSVGTGFWGSSSRAQANAMEIALVAASAVSEDDDDYNYNDTTPVAGTNDLTISAASQPGNSLAPRNAQGVAFTKFTLTAGDEDVNVDSILVQLTGLASRGSFDTIALLDEDGVIVGDTDSIDSDDQVEIGEDLVVRAGNSDTFTVVANMDNTVNAGEVASFSIIAINTDATVAGSLPITGAQHTMNHTLTVGSVEIGNAGGTGTNTVDILDDNVKLAELSIRAHDEDLRIYSVRLHQEGNADLDEAIDDIVARFDGNTYDVDIDGDYLTVDLEGVILKEGDREDLIITATIIGGANDTIVFEVEEVTDVVAVGVDFGYGARVDDDASPDNYTTVTLITIEISNANVTMSRTTDVDDEKVAAGSVMADLASFDVEAQGDDVTGDIVMIITTSGTFPTESSDADLDNVAIYTLDGDRISDSEDFSWSALGSTTITFKDVIFEASEDAIDYVIKGDINRDAPTGAIYTVTSIQYKSVETVDGDDVQDLNSAISGVQNDTAVMTLGHAQTVEGSAITVSIENADDQDINADTTGVVLAKIKLDADNSGDNINVSEIKIQFVVNDVSAGSKTVNNSDVRSCAIYSGTDRISDRENSDATSVSFRVDIDVDKDTETMLMVKCNLSNDFESGDTVVVTGVDFDARGLVTTTDLDTTFTTTTTSTITTGTLIFTQTTDDANDNKVAEQDTNDVSFGIFEYDSRDAASTIDDITVVMNVDVSNIIDGRMGVYINGNREDSVNVTTAAAVAEVTATGGTITVTGGTVVGDTYTVTIGTDAGTAVAWATSHAHTAGLIATDITANIAGYSATASGAVVTITTTLTGTAGNAVVAVAVAGAATVTQVNMTGGVDAVNANAVFSFTNIGHAVAKDLEVNVEFKADLRANATIGDVRIDSIVVTEKDGAVVNDSATDTSGDVTKPMVGVQASVPVVAKINTDTNNLSTADDVTLFAYSVTARGGDVTLGSVVFEITGANVTLGNSTVKVYDNATMAGSAIYDTAANIGYNGTLSATVDSHSQNLGSVVIRENDTYYVFFIADVTTSADTRSIRVQISDTTYGPNAQGMRFTTPGIDASLVLQGDMKSLLKRD